MCEAIVEVGFHFRKLSRVLVYLDCPVEKVYREATPRERANCPLQFTCFLCGEKRRKSEFAGEVLKQRICSGCSPYAEERVVGGIIRFDLRYGFTSYVRE